MGLFNIFSSSSVDTKSQLDTGVVNLEKTTKDAEEAKQSEPKSDKTEQQKTDDNFNKLLGEVESKEETKQSDQDEKQTETTEN